MVVVALATAPGNAAVLCCAPLLDRSPTCDAPRLGTAVSPSTAHRRTAAACALSDNWEDLLKATTNRTHLEELLYVQSERRGIVDQITRWPRDGSLDAHQNRAISHLGSPSEGGGRHGGLVLVR